MTALREQAIGMLRQIPESKVAYIVRILQGIKAEDAKKEVEGLTRSQIAYQNLQKYRRKQNADIDYKEELASALEEKYEGLN